MMNGNFNHLVAVEQINDMHRAAAQSRVAAGLPKPRTTRQPRELELTVSRTWLGLRRRPKVA